MHHIRQDVREAADVATFRFGAGIRASDGEAGKLILVIADKQRPLLTHLGIRVSPFHRRIACVPLELVAEATAETVTLRVPLGELTEHLTTPEGIVLTDSTRIAIAIGTGRSGEDGSGAIGLGRLGRLTQITCGRPLGDLHHLVVDRGRQGKALVPGRLVTEITARQIVVNLDRIDSSAPQHLVGYRSDSALWQDVSHALYNYPLLRIDLPGIELHIADGVVWLRGHVSSDGMR